MASIIFYSWQSDLPNSTNRGFIQAALEQAAKDHRHAVPRLRTGLRIHRHQRRHPEQRQCPGQKPDHQIPHQDRCTGRRIPALRNSRLPDGGILGANADWRPVDE